MNFEKKRAVKNPLISKRNVEFFSFLRAQGNGGDNLFDDGSGLGAVEKIQVARTEAQVQIRISVPTRENWRPAWFSGSADRKND